MPDSPIVLTNITELAILIKRHGRNSNSVSPADRTLVSLCLADILMRASGILFQWRRKFFPDEGHTLRYIYVPLIEFSVILSLLDLRLIIVERMISVSKPTAYREIFTPKQGISLIVTIWILTLTAMLALDKAIIRIKKQGDSLGCTKKSIEKYGKQQSNGNVRTALLTTFVDYLLDGHIKTTGTEYQVPHSQPDPSLDQRGVLEKDNKLKSETTCEVDQMEGEENYKGP